LPDISAQDDASQSDDLMKRQVSTLPRQVSVSAPRISNRKPLAPTGNCAISGDRIVTVILAGSEALLTVAWAEFAPGQYKEH
jgi:hypothetical protein